MNHTLQMAKTSGTRGASGSKGGSSARNILQSGYLSSVSSKAELAKRLTVHAASTFDLLTHHQALGELLRAREQGAKDGLDDIVTELANPAVLNYSE